MTPDTTPALRSLAGACLAVALIAPAAAVTTVPAAGIIATVLYNRGQRIDPTTFGHYEVAAPGGGMELDIQGQPFPAVQAVGQIATSPSTALFFGRSVGILTYFVGVNGPANAQVPVLIDVFGAISGLATPGASFGLAASWELIAGNQFLALDEVASGQQTGSFMQGFQRTVSVMLDTQTVYRVNLRADVGVAATHSSSAASGSAFMDPVFRFDAGVDTTQFQFVFSPGIGNQVPEPRAALLMALGLGLLAARRLRLSAAPA